jgi:uncharacterized protein DUF4440
MRAFLIFLWIILLACLGFSAQPAGQATNPQAEQSAGCDSALKEMFEAKIKVEWEALKNKDKKSYGEQLAEDYQGVEVDARGERNKIQSINEVSNLNVYNYNLWGFKVTPLGPDAAFVVYEVTIQFPPKSVVRYSRIYVTELWVKRGGQWRELHYQETQVK